MKSVMRLRLLPGQTSEWRHLDHQDTAMETLVHHPVGPPTEILVLETHHLGHLQQLQFLCQHTIAPLVPPSSLPPLDRGVVHPLAAEEIREITHTAGRLLIEVVVRLQHHHITAHLRAGIMTLDPRLEIIFRTDHEGLTTVRHLPTKLQSAPLRLSAQTTRLQQRTLAPSASPIT